MTEAVLIFVAVIASVFASVIFGKEDNKEGNKMIDRHFICIDSFESEGRYCLVGEVYTAYKIDGGYKLVFENGEMNFTDNLFERTLKAWEGVLVEEGK
ncbi:hypothetical protein [Enterococcus casseliflavus]|nr:hypothetical protein [Enterococcus casseliflavus]